VDLRRRELLPRQRCRRHPLRRCRTQPPLSGRAVQRAEDPDGLQAAWAALERTWAATLERVAAMPAGTVDVSVDGEWSFTQTLRHLVLATDMWLGKAILERDQPFHPLGIADASLEDEGFDMSIFSTATPSYSEVLEVRAGRVAMVREFLATVTPEQLAATHKNPHDPEYQETTLSCLHVILGEEWDHLRYAVRDLDSIEATPDT
jgi:DinB superfamily